MSRPAMPGVVAFDLDDTLAPSKSPIEPPMAALLSVLLDRTAVAVISGGQFGQFRSQVVAPLTAAGARRLDRLHLMPACGTQYYRFAGTGWVRRYGEVLSAAERQLAFTALERGARQLGLWSEHTWGPVLEDRESQVTFSALGQAAPIAEKAAWDPSGDKKRRLRDAVAAALPGLEVRAGGSTSLDVTRRGRDKAYGIRRLLEVTGLPATEVQFFGDQLGPGGNDHPVLALGVPCVAVTDWRDTERRVADLLAVSAATP